MHIIAGAPGSGKSTVLPLSAFGVDFFNADDEAAKRNGGSYLGIPQELRDQVNREFSLFIADHIQRKRSFSLETTLRTDITLKQAQAAREGDFFVEMFYIATESADINLRRVIARGLGGGHSAPAKTLLEIRTNSYKTLSLAIQSVGIALDKLVILDNSPADGALDFCFLLRSSKEGSLNLEVGRVPNYLRSFYEEAAARPNVDE